MKADDIRTLNERAQEQLLNTKSVAEHEAGFKSLLLSLLSELTAQHAEENEHIKRMLNSPLMYDTSNIDPVDWADLPQPVQFTVREPRATLRDQIAIAALSAIIGRGDMDTQMDVMPYCQDAYTIADAMMEAREK